jgi:hypothetical protein
MAKKKIAMVQPPLSYPKLTNLIKLLDALNNDRAYTVISHKGKTWEIHFEGDEESMILFEGEKPETN